MTVADPRVSPLRPVVLRRLLFVAALIAVFVMMGHAEFVGPEKVTLTDLVLRFVLALLTTSWCAVDGRVRGKPVPRVGLLVIFITSPLGILVYGVWSRGWRGLLFDLGLVALYFFTATVSIWLVLSATGRELQ